TKPLTQVKLDELIQVGGLLIDESWGFEPTELSNDTNRNLNQGRTGKVRAFNIQLGQVLPFIQVEVGQAPFDILRTYATRDGLLINVGKRGNLILFRPHYQQPTSYGEGIQFRSVKDGRRNNIVGSPRLRQTIDGLSSEVQCW